MQTLKDRLKKLQSDDFSLRAGLDRSALLNEMLDNIGSPDSELRDDLIYFSLQEWIASDPQIPIDDLCATWPRLLDDRHLFFHIGKWDNDSVFTRSFSALTLALYVYRHRQEAYLSSTDLREILAALCRYLPLEQDLRGFVPGFGWAHAMAHSADALDELALCTELDKNDLLQILAAILAGMSRPQAPFVQREDERMAAAFVSLVERDLIPLEDINAHLAEMVDTLREKPFDPQNFSAWNFRNFLRALYFRFYSANREDYAAMILKLETALMAPRS
jgi:hypothetical protein